MNDPFQRYTHASLDLVANVTNNPRAAALARTLQSESDELKLCTQLGELIKLTANDPKWMASLLIQLRTVIQRGFPN